MAAARTYRGAHREEWTEAVWMNGGASAVIDTDIPIRKAVHLTDTQITFFIQDQIGNPVIENVVKSQVTDKLRVAFDNTAAAGNQVKYLMRAEHIHSFVK